MVGIEATTMAGPWFESGPDVFLSSIGRAPLLTAVHIEKYRAKSVHRVHAQLEGSRRADGGQSITQHKIARHEPEGCGGRHPIL